MAGSTPSTHGSPSGSSSSSRERMLSMVAGLLGILMFVWGFFRWLKVDGENSPSVRFSGYAYSMPTTAVIGLSLAAGLIALLGATDRRAGRGVPSAVPLGLAATSLLLAIGILIGKGGISQNGGDVGVEIGLILGLITAAVQTVVLAIEMSSRRKNDHDDFRTGSTNAGYNR